MHVMRHMAEVQGHCANIPELQRYFLLFTEWFTEAVFHRNSRDDAG
jgi:hypothetical protein